MLSRISAGASLTLLASAAGLAQTSPSAVPVPVDTARMTMGQTDYSRYTSADACDRAVRQVWFAQLRIYIPDTTASAKPVIDSLPTAVVAAARACGTRFTVENTDVRELWSLLRISFVLGNEAMITGTITRLTTAAATPVARAQVLSRAIEILMPGILRGLPIRIGLVQDLLTQLDAIGPSVKVQCFEARKAMMQYWHAMYDTDSLRIHAQASLDLLQTMTQQERDAVEVFLPYNELFALANEAGDFVEQQTLLDRALADVGNWREGQGVDWTTPMASLLETRKSLYGKKTQPLSGSFWFNHEGIPRPVPGRLSLILHVSHACGTDCFPTYSLIKQLHREYGAELDITLITDTWGFAPGTGPISPADEAGKAAHYFHTYLRMPGALLVDETPHTRRPDGRIVRNTSPIGEMFNNWQMVNTLLIDREGRVRWIGMLRSGEDKRMIAAAIRRAIGAASASASTSVSPATNLSPVNSATNSR